MSVPKVSIVLLTFNRPDTLKLALQSALAQDYDDFGVIVMDNASTDNTPDVIRSFACDRLQHVRNERNIGIARNWNRGLAQNHSKYVHMFHDDDIMLPGFVRETVTALESNPSAAFALVQAQLIDENGTASGLQDVGDVPDGLMSGLDLLQLSVDGRGIGIFPPTIMMRGSAVAEALPLDSPHTRGYLDIDFYNRMAARHDVFFIRKQLVQYRVHGGSDTETLNREAGATPWYGELATKIDAIAPLLRSPRAADQNYRNWLADRLLELHVHQSASIHPSIPAMYHDWQTRLDIAAEQLQTIVPAAQSFILVDDNQLGIGGEWMGRRVLPFLERDGVYFGAPRTNEQAVTELQRMKNAGEKWIIFAWPCFWWLDRYWQLQQYIVKTFPCRFRSPHLVAYAMNA